MRIVSLLLLVVFLLVGWLVGWSNSSALPFTFLTWSTAPMPVFVFYFLFLFVGLMAGMVIGRFLNRS